MKRFICGAIAMSLVAPFSAQASVAKQALKAINGHHPDENKAVITKARIVVGDEVIHHGCSPRSHAGISLDADQIIMHESQLGSKSKISGKSNPIGVLGIYNGENTVRISVE